jgi:hypothetical protein
MLVSHRTQDSAGLFIGRGCKLTFVDSTAQIVEEIAKAIKKLGGDPTTITLTDKFQVNRVLEFLGGDMYLRCAVGSWRDTDTDEETLGYLRTWNNGESLKPDVSFVKK